MYADLGPGQMIDLDAPSPNGVDLLYSHDYVANRLRSDMRQRSPSLAEMANLYAYALSNPTNNIDPSGLAVAPTNGCTRVPDYLPFHIGGFDFGAACDAHDICYATCGMTRDQCDNRIFRDMKAKCDAGYLSSGSLGYLPNVYYDWWKCYNLARAYYAGIQLLALPSYQDAQKASGCIPQPPNC